MAITYKAVVSKRVSEFGRFAYYRPTIKRIWPWPKQDKITVQLGEPLKELESMKWVCSRFVNAESYEDIVNFTNNFGPLDNASTTFTIADWKRKQKAMWSSWLTAGHIERIEPAIKTMTSNEPFPVSPADSILFVNRVPIYLVGDLYRAMHFFLASTPWNFFKHCQNPECTMLYIDSSPEKKFCRISDVCKKTASRYQSRMNTQKCRERKRKPRTTKTVQSRRSSPPR